MVPMPNTDWRNRPVSYMEVSVVGDPAAGEKVLTRTVVRKLERALERSRDCRRRA